MRLKRKTCSTGHGAAKAALLVLALTFTGCGLHVPLPCGWVGKCPEPIPTPTPSPGPPSDCRQIPGPEACAVDERCVPSDDGTWHCVPPPPPPLDCQTEGCPAGQRCELISDSRYACVPQPVPTPTPTPVPEPTPTPTPTPDPGTCAFGNAESLFRVGIALHNIRPTSGQAIKDGYLGKVYVMNATPKSKPPFCPHQPDRRECEQLLCAQDPRGATFYMSLPGQWTNEPCDRQSNNPYICHHKPKRHEVGPTEFKACPFGAPPSDARCSVTVVNVG